MLDCFFGDPAGRQHHPNRTRLLELADELLEIGAAGDVLADQRLDGCRIPVEHHALVAVARQAANDISAHAPQADHADLHSSSPVICSCERLPDRLLESCQSRRDMWAEMHAQHPPIAFGQHLEIATGFRRLDDTEGVFLVRHLEIGGIVAGDLQEHAGVRAALVGLPRRMQEPRPEAEAGGDALAVADQDADILERLSMVLVAFDIGEERAIIAFSNTREMCREIFRQRPGLPECLAVLLVGEERKARLRKERVSGGNIPLRSYAAVSSRVLSLLASTSG